MRISFLSALLILLGGAPSLAAPPPSPVVKFTLSNGLTVRLHRVGGAKDVAMAVVYKVGNRHDPEGRSGMASVIAALYHSAATDRTKARPPESLWLKWPKGSTRPQGWRGVAADDHTLLARTLPPEALAAELEDAADRMAGLTVTEEDLRTAVSGLQESLGNLERGLVPFETARLRAREKVVTLPHGGRRPGRHAEIAKVTLEEVRTRLKEAYVPSNAILSIAGDIPATGLRPAIEKRFGALPRVEPPAVLPPPEEKPAPDAMADAEVVELPAGAKGSGAALALRAPEPGATPAYAAFLVLLARLYDASFAANMKTPADAVTAQVDVLQDAEAVYLLWKSPGASDPVAADARLRAALAEALAKPPGPMDPQRTHILFNVVFGVASLEGTWFYDTLIVAHGEARCAMLGLDVEALMQLIDKVTAKDLAAAGERARAVVVARPGK